jgi:hypothetical protein
VTTYTPDASVYLPDVYEVMKDGVATRRSVREAGGDVVGTELVGEAWKETFRRTPLADAPLYDGHTVYTDYASDGSVSSVEETTLTIEGEALTSVISIRNGKGEVFQTGKETGTFGRAVIVRSHGETLLGRVMLMTHEERETKGKDGTAKETLDTAYGDDERVVTATQTRSFDAVATKVEGEVSTTSCLPELLCLQDPQGATGAYALSATATYTYDDDGRMTAAEVSEFTGAERSAAGSHQEFKVEREYAAP